LTLKEGRLPEAPIEELGPVVQTALGRVPCLPTRAGRPVAVVVPVALDAEAAEAGALASAGEVLQAWLSSRRERGIGGERGLHALEKVARALSDVAG